MVQCLMLDRVLRAGAVRPKFRRNRLSNATCLTKVFFKTYTEIFEGQLDYLSNATCLTQVFFKIGEYFGR